MLWSVQLFWFPKWPVITLAIKALLAHRSAWKLYVCNCRSCSRSSSCRGLKLLRTGKINKQKFWLAILGFSLWSCMMGVEQSSEASPDRPEAANCACLGLTWGPRLSLGCVAGAVGSRWVARSLEAAVKWCETHEGAVSRLVIQWGWLGFLLPRKHLRMKYRSDHSWKAIYLQLFLLSWG